MHKDYVEWFSPDIDVLAVTRNEVISHEVKLLEGKKTGIPTRINMKTSEVIEELMTVRLVDGAIYDGLGKALFNSLKSDKSYLVLPTPGMCDDVLDIVETLPIGLITFKGEGGSFSLMKEADYQRRSQMGDEIFELGRDEEDRLTRLIFSKKF